MLTGGQCKFVNVDVVGKKGSVSETGDSERTV